MTERFELLTQLGRGGMGTVWKARDAETGEVVALKLLHSIYVDDPDYVARFELEVEVAQRIDSPHVVKVLGYGRREGVPYVAMEYVEGLSLRERLRDHGPVGWDEAKRLAIQTAEALSAAHAAGVIHRDIKPSNVLLDADGNVKLADFGIARAADLTRMTGTVTILGTPAYMSPDGDASEQADLYGLGCVLYELLVGSPPFEAESQQQVLLKHIREAPNMDRLPPPAGRVVGWLLEKDPRRRPQSADALLAVLTGSSVRGTGPVRVPPSRRRTGRWVAVGMLGSAGLAFIGLAAAFWSSAADGDDEPTPVPLLTTTSTQRAQATATTTPPSRPAGSQTATPPGASPTATTPATSRPPGGSTPANFATQGPSSPTATPSSTKTPTRTPVATSTPGPTRAPNPTPLPWDIPPPSNEIAVHLLAPAGETCESLLEGLLATHRLQIVPDAERRAHALFEFMLGNLNVEPQICSVGGWLSRDDLLVPTLDWFWLQSNLFEVLR